MPLVILTCGISKFQGRKVTRNRQSTIDTIMEHGQAMRLEELKKKQQDLKEKMYQLTEMMTSLIKEKRIVEGPNLQEGSVHEKSDNQKVGHPGRFKLISFRAQIKPFVRQIVNPELNSGANITDSIAVSNLAHLFG